MVWLTALPAGLAGVGAWMCFQYIPAWYRPLWLTRAEVETVRREAEEAFDIITRKMAAGKSCSVSLTGQQLNELLSARRIIWPASDRKLPADLRTPCVAIHPDYLDVGLRWQRGRVQTILHTRLAIGVSGDRLDIERLETRAGALPLPAMLLRRLQSRDAATPRAALFDVASARLSVPNAFVWPNGKIPFRIGEIRLGPGEMVLRLEPAP